jgi:excisionase family DNA binding protein
MNNETDLPNLQDYISIKEAAQMLGLAYKTVYEYITEGRIRAVRAADIILIPTEEVRNFKPNISGRPRTSIPQWRISPTDNTLQHTSIFAQIHEGKMDDFKRKLDEIRHKKEHLFPGTIARYVLGNNDNPHQIEIILIWRISVMPDETTRQQALEGLKQALDDIVDWTTARFQAGNVFMHA